MTAQSNYQTTALTTLAVEINEHHRQAEASAKTALEHARAAGDLLLQAKGKCQHGTWGEWLVQNFQGSTRTAQRYMGFSKRWPELEAKTTRVADLPIREAARLLADSGPIDLDVEIHPAANMFPEFDGDGYEAMKADIAKYGQKVPITFYCGQLLDGRARLRACRELGIQPLTRNVDGIDPVAYSVAMNLHRTHQTANEPIGS
ncbi:MAG: DUF3102 domain-containing protein [Planctomycetaceae bacterium]|nr:DUF3102 domain-containing protein [Planctomycetaceae bacterium]